VIEKYVLLIHLFCFSSDLKAVMLSVTGNIAKDGMVLVESDGECLKMLMADNNRYSCINILYQ
jgi:hypothetical protein